MIRAASYQIKFRIDLRWTTTVLVNLFNGKNNNQQLNNRLQPTSDGEISFKLIETLIRSQMNQMSCDVVQLCNDDGLWCDSTLWV